MEPQCTAVVLPAPWARLPAGCWALRFFPAAAALADSYEIIPDPSSTETLTGVYGLENTVPPAETGSIQGYQEFEVLDTTSNQVVGTFYADESNSIDITGNTNSVLLVTSDSTGTVGTAAGDIPAVGSVIDSYNYAGDEFGYTYSALTSTPARRRGHGLGYLDDGGLRRLRRWQHL